jgi:hypothetical protein
MISIRTVVLERTFAAELLELLKTHEAYHVALDVQQSARTMRPPRDASVLTRETQALRTELEQRLAGDGGS